VVVGFAVSILLGVVAFVVSTLVLAHHGRKQQPPAPTHALDKALDDLIADVTRTRAQPQVPTYVRTPRGTPAPSWRPVHAQLDSFAENAPTTLARRPVSQLARSIVSSNEVVIDNVPTVRR
jgi:hypothetical protein